MSFVFWVIVYRVADGAFKGYATVIEVLAAKLPKGRELRTLEWNETAKDLLFFRIVTSEGSKSTKVLTFSLLRHNFTSLA
jgi:topoisomerase IA-like protein